MNDRWDWSRFDDVLQFKFDLQSPTLLWSLRMYFFLSFSSDAMYFDWITLTILCFYVKYVSQLLKTCSIYIKSPNDFNWHIWNAHERCIFK